MDQIDTKGPFLNFINKFIHLDDKKREQVLKSVTSQYCSKNTILVQQGETCKKFYFIISGGVRIYYLTQQGREKTRLILFENSPFTALLSFITARPAVEFIEVLEESHFAVMTRHDFFNLVQDMPEWSTFYRMLLEKMYIYQNTRLEQLATLSAGERYQKVLHESPNFIQRLPNSILASYLDITQETLSRLKSK